MVEMKTITIENKTAEELKAHLLKELALFKEIDNRFKKKYKMTLTQLERKIKMEGVPVKSHDVWEDSIERRNAVEEAKKLQAILGALRQMSLSVLLETARKLLRSPTVLYVRFLGTKVRALFA